MHTVSLTPHFLYFLWNAIGELLYVGITDNPSRRFAEHQKTQPWWSEVATRKCEIYDSKLLAEMAEKEAIVSMHPKYNKKDKALRPNLGAAQAVKFDSRSSYSWRWTRDARWALFFIKAGIKFGFAEHVVDGVPVCGVFILKGRHERPHLFIAANKPKGSDELDHLALGQYRATFKLITSQLSEELMPQSCVVAVSTHNRFAPPAMYAWKTPFSMSDAPFRCGISWVTVEGTFARADGTWTTDDDPRPCEWFWRPDGSVVFFKGEWTGEEESLGVAFDHARQSLMPADPPEIFQCDWSGTIRNWVTDWYSTPQPLEHWMDYDKLNDKDTQSDDSWEDF